MLTLIATPIGNIQDISLRAIEALRTCDLLLCEDTRRTAKLLQLLDIPAPKMKSLHKFNERARIDELVSLLQQNISIGLVSDAGTPGISDPGSLLVERCHRENIPVTIVPGPCAFACALALSGTDRASAQFIGFLPKKASERTRLLHDILLYSGVSIAYESPNRVLETISMAAQIDPLWVILLVRELTKLYEQVIRKSASDLHDLLSKQEIKGECTLVFYPVPIIHVPSNEKLISDVKTVRERFNCPLKEAVELIAKQYSISKNKLYKICTNA